MIPRTSLALLATLSMASCGGTTVMHLGDTDKAGSSGGAAGAQGVGAGGQGIAGSISMDTGGTDVTMAMDAGAATFAPNAGQSVPLAMTNFEYANTVRDLLDDTSDSLFTPDPIEAGFRREQAPVNVDRVGIYANAANQLALKAVGHLSMILPCDPAAIGEVACANQFIAAFGRRAFRRPLTAAESADMQQGYAQGRMGGDFASGIQQVITRLLMSPQFYEIEPKGTAPGLAPLGPFQQASRLSYFIYRSMPDAELLDAAEGGKLATADGVVTQAKRMLADPKAHNGVINFFSEWLALDRLDTTLKDPTLFPTFDSLRADMATETTKFAESIFFGDGRFTSLLQSSKTWLNAPLAALYGQAGVTGSFQQVQLDPKVRAGILTQASFLSLNSDSMQSSPTLRGIFVRNKILCGLIPAPPPNTPPLQPQMPGQTNRERYQASFTSPVCAACHSLIEPIGYGLEQFDAVGRFRVTDNGKAVDASGNLAQVDGVAGPFTGAVELAAELASSGAARECQAKQWFRYALSRQEAEEDSCALATAVQAIQTSGSLPELVIALVSSDSFRYARW